MEFKDLPKAMQQDTEQEPVQSYIIGTISIDADGVWRCHYIGHHEVLHRKYFGNGSISSRNIRQMLNVVGSRLNNKKDVYLDKIIEVSNAPKSSDTEQVEDQPAGYSEFGL